MKKKTKKTVAKKPVKKTKKPVKRTRGIKAPPAVGSSVVVNDGTVSIAANPDTTTTTDSTV